MQVKPPSKFGRFFSESCSCVSLKLSAQSFCNNVITLDSLCTKEEEKRLAKNFHFLNVVSPLHYLRSERRPQQGESCSHYGSLASPPCLSMRKSTAESPFMAMSISDDDGASQKFYWLSLSSPLFSHTDIHVYRTRHLRLCETLWCFYYSDCIGFVWQGFGSWGCREKTPGASPMSNGASSN